MLEIKHTVLIVALEYYFLNEPGSHFSISTTSNKPFHVVYAGPCLKKHQNNYCLGPHIMYCTLHTNSIKTVLRSKAVNI